jgi:hypothetical protein
MLKLEKSLRAWGGPDFEAILKQEVADGAQHLPLQQGLASCNYVADAPVTLLIRRVAETEKVIRIRAGIFYQGIIGGCNCADDPTPASEITEYCVVQLDIDKTTAATAVVLVSE